MPRQRRGRGSLEARVLATLWSAGRPLTVGEVVDGLEVGLAHTTVQTILVRLCAKGAVSRERVGRGHVYRPVLAEADLVARRMLRVLDSEPDRTAVLSRFVADLSATDEAALIAVLRRIGAD
jgi:predicted transcriptional regulator